MAKRFEQQAQAIKRDIDHRSGTRLSRLFLHQIPRSCIGEIAIERVRCLNQRLNTGGELRQLNLLGQTLRSRKRLSANRFIRRFQFAAIGYAIKARFCKLARTAEQIAKLVRQLAGIGLRNRFYRDLAIAIRAHVPREVIAQRIDAIFLGHFNRIDDIAQRLRHLHAAFAQPMAVHDQTFGQGQVKRHQHGWPINAVGLQNILADQVTALLPPRLIIAIGKVEIGEIVQQRIEPHIGHMLCIKR